MKSQHRHRCSQVIRAYIERGLSIFRFRGVEAEELGELATVLRVLVLAEGLVELLEVLLVLTNLSEEIHALLDDVLASDLEDFVLLEGLSEDVEREILGVNDTLAEVEVLGDEVLAAVHDEDVANVELDVVGGPGETMRLFVVAISR